MELNLFSPSVSQKLSSVPHPNRPSFFFSSLHTSKFPAFWLGSGMSEPNTVIAVFVLVPAQLEAGNTEILLGNALLWRLSVQFCRFMSVTCFRQSSERQPKPSATDL